MYEFLERIRRDPAKKWIPAFLLLLAERLLEHRLLAWANEKLDEGAGPVIAFLQGILADSIKHPWVSGFCILGTYAFGVVLWAYVPIMARFFRKSPGLEFQEIHASSSRSYPANASYDPLWIAVTNRTLGDAKKVTARVSFRNDFGTQSVPEMDCRWHRNTERDGMIGGGWAKATDILSGDDQSFVLLDTAKTNEVWVRDASEAPVALLQAGQRWVATIKVESENVRGFEGTIGFAVTRRGTSEQSFSKRRDIPPRHAK